MLISTSDCEHVWHPVMYFEKQRDTEADRTLRRKPCGDTTASGEGGGLGGEEVA